MNNIPNIAISSNYILYSIMKKKSTLHTGYLITTATKCFWKLIFKMRKRKSYNGRFDILYYMFMYMTMTLVYNIFLWYEQSQWIDSNEWFGSIQCDWNVPKWNSGCEFFHILLKIKICIQNLLAQQMYYLFISFFSLITLYILLSKYFVNGIFSFCRISYSKGSKSSFVNQNTILNYEIKSKCSNKTFK